MEENKNQVTESAVSETQTAPSIKKYTPEELLEKRRKERIAAERAARREREKYYAFYDDVKTDEDPSW